MRGFHEREGKEEQAICTWEHPQTVRRGAEHILRTGLEITKSRALGIKKGVFSLIPHPLRTVREEGNLTSAKISQGEPKGQFSTPHITSTRV